MIRSYPKTHLRAYSQKGKTVTLAAPVTNQLALFNLRAANNSGGAITVGLCRAIPISTTSTSSDVKLWTLTGGGLTYTQVNSQSETFFTTTNNDGFVFQSKIPFNLIGFTIANNVSGLTVTYQYWNSAGALASLTTLENPANYNSAGDNYIVFRSPMDWAVGGPTGVDQAMYSIVLTATTAGASGVTVSAIWLGEFLECIAGVSNNSIVQMTYPDSKPFVLHSGEGVFPYFSTANASNMFGAYYAVI